MTNNVFYYIANVKVGFKTDDSIDDRDSIKKSTSDSSQSESKDSVVDLDGLTQKLQKSDSTICTLKQEVSNLKAVIEKLNTENYELRTRLSQAGTNSITSFNGDSGCSSLDGFLMVKNSYTTMKQNKKTSKLKLVFNSYELQCVSLMNFYQNCSKNSTNLKI